MVSKSMIILHHFKNLFKYLKLYIILINISFCYLSNAQNSDIITSGDNSPAIYAKNISITYGVRIEIINELLEIYEKKDIPKNERLEKVETLIKKYSGKKGNINKLGEDDKKNLNIENEEEIVDILNWDIFLTTKGKNSPAIYATGAEVGIWYGIPKEAFKTILEKLEKNKNEFENMESQLMVVVNHYKELERELGFRIDYDEVAKEANQLLINGDIDSAEILLKNDVLNSNKNSAARNYEYAKVLDVNLKYHKSIEYYCIAYQLDKDNYDYCKAYITSMTENSRYDELISFCNDALESLSKTDKLYREKTFLFWNHLGVAYMQKGEYRNAISYLSAALKYNIEILGANHRHLSAYLNNLGSVYLSIGEYDMSIDYFLKSIDNITKYYGQSYLNLSTIYNNVGTAYKEKGEYEKSLNYYLMALRIDLDNYGDRHPNTALTYNNLGVISYQKEDYNKALEYHQQALDIDKEAFGEFNSITVTDYLNLGKLYDALNEYDKSIEFCSRALQINLDSFGEGHPLNAQIYNSLGEPYRHMKDYDNALKYFKHAEDVGIKYLGKDHPKMAFIYNNLGVTYDRLGETDIAIQYYNRTLNILQKTLPPNNYRIKNMKQKIENVKSRKM